MASGLTTFLVVATVGVGGYALYRWWEEDRKHGEHWRRKEAQHLKDAQVSGYFAGVQSGPAIVGADAAGYYGMNYYVGDPAAVGADATGYYGMNYYVGDGHAPTPPDPRNCLCPMSLDPLDPTLPIYKCPCNVPGAIRPPYAGYMAVGRGGGGGHYRRPPQQEQEQQAQQQDGGGGPGDPNAPPYPPQPPYTPPQHRHPHHGRR